jgi:hypothetical protein
MMMITREQFRIAVGCYPGQEALERCNCELAGQIGHWFCGWCDDCDRPRFVCGHDRRTPHDGGA